MQLIVKEFGMKGDKKNLWGYSAKLHRGSMTGRIITKGNGNLYEIKKVLNGRITPLCTMNFEDVEETDKIMWNYMLNNVCIPMVTKYPHLNLKICDRTKLKIPHSAMPW